MKWLALFIVVMFLFVVGATNAYNDDAIKVCQKTHSYETCYNAIYR